MSSAEIVRARRACTVPNQLLKTYELPSLRNALTVPKRYEETKPAKVQNFTHQRIIDLGEYINRQSMEEVAKQKQAAVEKAIADTWEAAHQIKMQAVSEALQKAQVQHEKQLKRLAEQHDRALKEEALMVETMMQNKMREALESERVLALKTLEETVEQVKVQCAIDLQEAVIVAREEEQKAAHNEKMKLLDEAAYKLRVTKEELAEEKHIALVELAKVKEEEKLQAVNIAHSKEQEIKRYEIAEVKQHHVMEIERLKKVITNTIDQIKGKDQEVEKVQRKREQLYDELVKVQADFQNFIDKHPMFDPGQTGYLLADLNANPKVINPHNDVLSMTKHKTRNK